MIDRFEMMKNHLEAHSISTIIHISCEKLFNLKSHKYLFLHFYLYFVFRIKRKFTLLCNAIKISKYLNKKKHLIFQLYLKNRRSKNINLIISINQSGSYNAKLYFRWEAKLQNKKQKERENIRLAVDLRKIIMIYWFIFIKLSSDIISISSQNSC